MCNSWHWVWIQQMMWKLKEFRIWFLAAVATAALSYLTPALNCGADWLWKKNSRLEAISARLNWESTPSTSFSRTVQWFCYSKITSKYKNSSLWLVKVKNGLTFSSYVLHVIKVDILTQWAFNPHKCHCEAVGLHEFYHHSDILSCITFHIK